MRTVSRTGYLTLRQAAAWIGIGDDRAAALRLQRILRRAERRFRRQIIRQDARGPGTPILVTKAALRDYLPEHFEKRSELESVVRRRFEMLEREQQIARKERRELGARILTHERRCHDLP